MHEVLCATDLLSFHMFTHIICPVCLLKPQCPSYPLATKIVLPDKVKSIIAIKDESFIFGIYGAVITELDQGAGDGIAGVAITIYYILYTI